MKTLRNVREWMLLLKYLSLCVAILCHLALVNALPRYHSIHKRNIKLCGNKLVEALAIVCNSEYYDPTRRQLLTKKRNYAYVADSYPGSFQDEGSMTEFDGFVDPQTALDFLGRPRNMPRSTRGVADECCMRSCSFYQLLAYCSPAATD